MAEKTISGVRVCVANTPEKRLAGVLTIKQKKLSTVNFFRMCVCVFDIDYNHCLLPRGFAEK